MLITLEHYSRSHNLKQIFAKARLWFGRRKVTLAIARICMLTLACLHVVNHDDCDVKLCRYFLEADEPLRHCPFALCETMLINAKMLTKSVKHDQFKAWEF